MIKWGCALSVLVFLGFCGFIWWLYMETMKSFSGGE